MGARFTTLPADPAHYEVRPVEYLFVKLAEAFGRPRDWWAVSLSGGAVQLWGLDRCRSVRDDAPAYGDTLLATFRPCDGDPNRVRLWLDGDGPGGVVRLDDLLDALSSPSCAMADLRRLPGMPAVDDDDKNRDD